MCQYCDEEYPKSIVDVRRENESTDVYVDYTQGVPTLAMEILLFGASTYHSRMIYYCPMCGRDLRKRG